MPVTYQIDPAGSLVRTSCTGRVGLSEVLEHFSTLQYDPARPVKLDVLLDMSGMVSHRRPSK